VRKSERDRFRQFVTECSPALYRVAVALTGGHHAAEDLLQDCLARTFVRWSTVRGDPAAYVRRAMYHTQVSVWRRRRLVRELPPDAAPEPIDRRDDIAATDRRLALRQALLRLGPRQRAVLVARYFEDLSEQDTATLLGCSTGTVRSQTHRALARLREFAPDLREDTLTIKGVIR
jgi:RNA polymerase sigma-70 factor (sigma-E family)